MSRPSGLSVVVGIQRPSAEIFPRDSTLQFGNRFLMAPNVADLDTKRMLFPMTDVKGLPLNANIRAHLYSMKMDLSCLNLFTFLTCLQSIFRKL